MQPTGGVYPHPICIRYYGRIDRTGNRVSISGNIISVTERTFVAVGGCVVTTHWIPRSFPCLSVKTARQIWQKKIGRKRCWRIDREITNYREEEDRDISI